MATTSTVRIATVLATGRRFIVNYLDTRGAGGRGIAHCWGEVERVRPKTRRGHVVGYVRCHGAPKKFILDKVRIEEIPNVHDLSLELFEEYIQSLRDQGYRITRKGRRHKTYVIGPKDPDHKAKALATEMGASWWSLSVEDRDALRELAA